MDHPIQGRALDEHFSELVLDLPRLKPVTEDRLVAKDRRLSQTAPMIMARALPLCAPHLPDAAQVLIPDVSFSFRVAVLPDACSLARWNGCPRPMLIDGVIAFPFIV